MFGRTFGSSPLCRNFLFKKSKFASQINFRRMLRILRELDI